MKSLHLPFIIFGLFQVTMQQTGGQMEHTVMQQGGIMQLQPQQLSMNNMNQAMIHSHVQGPQVQSLSGGGQWIYEGNRMSMNMQGAGALDMGHGGQGAGGSPGVASAAIISNGVIINGQGTGLSSQSGISGGGGQNLQGIQGTGMAQGMPGTGMSQAMQGNGMVQNIQAANVAQGIQGANIAQTLQGSNMVQVQGMMGQSFASNGMSQTMQSNGMAQGMQSNGMAQGMQSNGIVQGMQSNGIAQGMQSNGMAQGMQSNGMAQGMQSNGMAQGIQNNGIAQGVQNNGMAQQMQNSGNGQGAQSNGMAQGVVMNVMPSHEIGQVHPHGVFMYNQAGGNQFQGFQYPQQMVGGSGMGTGPQQMVGGSGMGTGNGVSETQRGFNMMGTTVKATAATTTPAPGKPTPFPKIKFIGLPKFKSGLIDWKDVAKAMVEMGKLLNWVAGFSLMQ